MKEINGILIFCIVAIPIVLSFGILIGSLVLG